ncbi:MAG: hypothetical protein AB1656_13535 [Candidatus Omnitrophota bacterium]
MPDLRFCERFGMEMDCEQCPEPFEAFVRKWVDLHGDGEAQTREEEDFDEDPLYTAITIHCPECQRTIILRNDWARDDDEILFFMNMNCPECKKIVGPSPECEENLFDIEYPCPEYEEENDDSDSESKESAADLHSECLESDGGKENNADIESADDGDIS